MLSLRLTRLYYGLMNTIIDCQVSYDANNVPLNLQGVPTELVNPLEELQTPVGNNVIAVTLDLEVRQKCFN